MLHLSMQDRNGVIGHHQADVSVSQIFKTFNLKKSIYKLIDKLDNEGIVKHLWLR